VRCSLDDTMRGLVPVGRSLFALIFIASIFGHFSEGAIAHAAAHGVPVANILVPLAGILALVAFLVPVTFVMHRFWGLPDPQLAELQKIMFMKNLSLAGAAMLIMYWGSGPYSLDG
jgi:putative oxidoreductase